MYGPGDVRVETIPDARLLQPTDALVRVTHAAICGSDLWPYKLMERSETGGIGAHSILECVGSGESIRTSVNIVRPGGAIGRVGVPHYEAIPAAETAFYYNVTVSGGPAPVRAYMKDLIPDVLTGRVKPGRVFDLVTSIDGAPEGYRAMNEREVIKVMIKFYCTTRT
jgi:threonine dehydrogenase-like Zn-dependent dehydrogenase